jgi:hypothetical protein
MSPEFSWQGYFAILYPDGQYFFSVSRLAHQEVVLQIISLYFMIADSFSSNSLTKRFIPHTKQLDWF